MRTNQFPEAVSNIPGIVHQYMHQEMTEAVREAVQIQTDRLQDSLQRENDEFLRTIDDNINKIIKEQVKSQVKAKVTRILPRIEESVNAQLEAEVLTRSSHSSRTSYDVAADLSEMELKKILIDKMEGNKEDVRMMMIRKDPLLDQTESLPRRREDDDQEGPSAGSDRESKRRREGGEHASASTPSETATGVHADLPQGLNLDSCLPPRRPPTPNRDWNKTFPAAQGNDQSWISELARKTDSRSLFNELLDTPIDFSNFIMNRLCVDTLTPELLAGPTYELMRGSCNSLTELEYHLEEVYKVTTDQLDWVNREVNRESALDVYSKRRIIAVTELKIVKWHSYKHLDWISPRRPPTPDRDWNKTLPTVQGSAQSWISELAKQADARSSFNELLDTPLDFSNFIMNRLDVDTLTLELLAGPTYELMRGSCQQYPHNLLQPLPLIPDNRGRRVIPFVHFINNNLEYLRGGASSRKYTTSVTKTKAADYGHIKWIEDLVPQTMWIQEPLNYNKHTLWGVSYWGRKRQQFYEFAVNQESALDEYSKRRIIAITDLKIVEWHNYKHLDWISVHRDDDKIYKFKECDFKRLHLQDIEDMLLLLVQGKLSNQTVEERFAFNVSLRMFTRSIVIQQRVEDLQLGVKSYQKRLNLTKPDTYRSYLKRREAYTAYSYPRGFIYQNKDKKNRLMRIDELQKFSDRMLNDVRNALDDRLKGIRMQYLPTTI
nr:hypothetical protein [Tanacetum cinerariifolium]